MGLTAFDTEGRPLRERPLLRHGDPLRVVVTGFRPRELIQVTMFSTPRGLPPQTAGPAGQLTYRLNIPGDLEAGTHLLSFQGADRTMTFAFQLPAVAGAAAGPEAVDPAAEQFAASVTQGAAAVGAATRHAGAATGAQAAAAARPAGARPAAAGAARTRPSGTVTRSLARTGTDFSGQGGLGMLLVAAGLLLLIVAARMRRTEGSPAEFGNHA